MNNFVKRFDWFLLAYLILLLLLGLATVYAAVSHGNLALFYKQLVYCVLGLSIFLGLCFIPLRFIALLAWPAYLLPLLALALIPFIGDIHMGARRWLDLGVVNLQPSELMKWALVLVLAHWFASRDCHHWRVLLMALSLMLMPAGLIIIQPDLGTTLLLLAAGCAMILAAGLPWRWCAIAVVLVLAAMPVLWHNMQDYQKTRVISFMNPQDDALGSGYHVIQSMIAIGSGGTFGKGYLHGTQNRLNFLPEQHTDFIFAVLSEEGGLIAVSLLLLLYGLLIFRILSIAQKASSRFGSLLCIGVASLFLLYLSINIGMVSGVLPVVGVPLPLISYGGSALITLIAALGLVMRTAMESHARIPWQRPTSPFM